MPTYETPSGKLAREYIKKYSTLSKRAIAKKLYGDYPVFFTDVEHARYIIRTKTGSAGVRNREYMVTVPYNTPFTTENPRGNIMKKIMTRKRKKPK